MSNQKQQPEQRRVLLEVKLPRADTRDMNTPEFSHIINTPGFKIDNDFIPVPMSAPAKNALNTFDSEKEVVYIIAGMLNESVEDTLSKNPNILKIWSDDEIQPFAEVVAEIESDPSKNNSAVSPVMNPMAPCPIGVCDCNSGLPKGTMADVRRFIGVNNIHAAGFTGSNIVVGVVDSGVTAQGRTLRIGEAPSRLIPNVVDGWPSDWGTQSSSWSYHGNMCATDVLGMAPDCRIYDLRISNATTYSGLVSNALQAFQWAINHYHIDGTPHVLTNSWGMFQKVWLSDYTDNPDHPFTRKVVEAIELGIIVLFAAGNCGQTCPDGRCRTDNGPGKSIWGANGHPFVMTVGAVNPRGEYIGYSSQGPAALDPNKPDFCSISHFTGYFNSDSGTSAATPIAAGVVALLKQHNRGLNQLEAKAALQETCRPLGAPGWDQFSGYGIINAWDAFNYNRPVSRVNPFIGVQFTGILGAGQTVCWYSWGWPAAWHVIWHAIPVTPGTRIKWQIQTERAANNYITYWICITNLSTVQAQVEGRFAVLGS